MPRIRFVENSFVALALQLFAVRADAQPPPDENLEPKLRPCCALGKDVAPRVGGIGVPVVLGNVVDPRHLGEHQYESRSSLNERSGILYTCEAGVIDLAHFRTSADRVGHLYLRIKAALRKNQGFELNELGHRIRVVPEKDAALRFGNPRIDEEALKAAEGISYAISVLHEISTWNGSASYSLFSEGFSAFSPEDLYSDALGARVGALAVRSERPFDEAMSVLTRRTLESLGALEADGSRQALEMLNGRVFHSEIPVPEFNYLAKRNFDTGPELTPWRIPESMLTASSMESKLLSRCSQSSARRLASPVVPQELVTASFEPIRTDDSTPPRWVSAEGLQEVAQKLKGEAETEHGHQLTTWPPDDWAASSRPKETRSPAAEFEAIRLLHLRASGGAQNWERGAGAAQVTGGQGLTDGGDINIMTYEVLGGPVARGVVHHLRGIESRNAMFCAERGTGVTHGPLFALFQNCRPDAWLGMGGLIGAVQHDTNTTRTIIRPLQLQLTANLLANGHHEDYLKRHLVLFAGAATDTLSRFSSPDLSTAPQLSLRGLGGLLLTLRSSSMTWELQAHGIYRHDFLELGADWSTEAGLRLGRRFFLGNKAPNRPGTALLFFGIHGGMTYFNDPIESYTDWVAPLASDREEFSHQLLGIAEFNYEGFVL